MEKQESHHNHNKSQKDINQSMKYLNSSSKIQILKQMQKNNIECFKGYFLIMTTI